MNEGDIPRRFNTLRGFLRGNESAEPMYSAYCASLRIFGDLLPLEEITRELGVTPTETRRKGEYRKPTSARPYPNDAWFLRSTLPETEPLHRHIDEIWFAVKPRADYLRQLKQCFRVDVFCGYRTNIDHGGIEVPTASLEMFTVLEIPFGCSIIVTE